ncbi:MULTISPECIES: hypothetical protein [unclassified Mesorhizobium]|uniref:hypothetical protein n=1 Tax=unclassified Mesorhizobium TaxID=325217 RepID=UPI0003CF59F8|nr:MULTISPECIES: hypothetical protein [unclassified Mesorhizobium]ESY56582.1 hypothetical protein X745_05940 [Mesorhizobium sp. LNJC374B00]ESY61315.1 hypothetical protein X744_06260 [Mesorhizobium sp. LNJC372A00]WJI80837.1 DUF2256 domain-containing protein [Mesorhizobium sp. C374B]WJI87376.1 DUF2256 domain-containing protein [Mesorhizobium sp. C372A]
MISIRLQWERPADGVELAFDGDAIRARTPRSIPVTYEVTDLENPIVLHLINCRTNEDRVAFLSRFGFLRQDKGWLGMTGVEVEQDRLSASLTEPSLSFIPLPQIEYANQVMNEQGYQVSLRPAFEEFGGEGLRLVLHPDSLSSFMAMEVALAHEAGAALTMCEHCGKSFLTGPLTGRRSHAKYCSDRCRVAAMRKRNAAKGE